MDDKAKQQAERDAEREGNHEVGAGFETFPILEGNMGSYTFGMNPDGSLMSYRQGAVGAERQAVTINGLQSFTPVITDPIALGEINRLKEQLASVQAELAERGKFAPNEDATRLSVKLSFAEEALKDAKAEISRLRAQLDYQEDNLYRYRELFSDLKKRPVTCSYMTAIFLYLAAYNVEDPHDYLEIGKGLQRLYGLDRVSTKTEVEIGNGIWSVIRLALGGNRK